VELEDKAVASIATFPRPPGPQSHGDSSATPSVTIYQLPLVGIFDAFTPKFFCLLIAHVELWHYLMTKTSKKRRRDTRRSPTLAQSTPSAIENCPTEIWGRIFSLACVDDGFTGRSLSRVSRYIMEASSPYKYQCIAVKDHQFRPLTLVLKKLPADKRRVQCLFLAQVSNSWRNSEFFITDKNRLLKMVAPTLEKLEIVCYYYRFPLPFELPVLVDLTLYGRFDNTTTKIITCFPALKHLEVESFPFPDYEPTLISILRATAPILSVIRLSVSFNPGTMATFSTLRASLPIQKIIFRPHASFVSHEFYQVWRTEYLQNLRKNGRSDDGLIPLKPGPTQSLEFRTNAASKRWSEACAGRINYWEPSEGELDPEFRAA
jgi:hypothetical protein